MDSMNDGMSGQQKHQSSLGLGQIIIPDFTPCPFSSSCFPVSLCWDCFKQPSSSSFSSCHTHVRSQADNKLQQPSLQHTAAAKR
jgi:hypothetical protein